MQRMMITLLIAIATVAVTFTVVDEAKAQNSYTLTCPSGTCRYKLVAPELKPVKLPGHMALTLGVFGNGAKDGPSIWGFDGQIIGDIRVVDWLYARIAAGAGLGWEDGETRPVLAEFFGPMFPLGEWGQLSLGARHRVAFLADGDRFNGLLGAAQLDIRLKGPWWLKLSGGVGRAWFPKTEKVEGILETVGAEAPMETTVHSGVAWEAAASLVLYLF